MWRNIIPGRALAEVASVVAGNLTAPSLKYVAPEQYKAVANQVAEKVIEPHLSWWENNIIDKPILAHGQEAYNAATNNKERAQAIGEAVLDVAVLWSGTMVAQGIAQTAYNKSVGLPELEGINLRKMQMGEIGKSVAIDKAVNLGALVVMQGAFPDVTSKVADNFAQALKGVGVPEKTSKMLFNVQLPNLLGAVASVQSMTKAYKVKFDAVRNEHNLPNRQP
jgi:hypothetical protein